MDGSWLSERQGLVEHNSKKTDTLFVYRDSPCFLLVLCCIGLISIQKGIKFQTVLNETLPSCQPPSFSIDRKIFSS